MLYLAADTSKGRLICLGLLPENVNEIKADNPLIARLMHCGTNGLFFLCLKESKKMEELLKGMEKHYPNINCFCYGASIEELDAFARGEGAFLITPGEHIPDVSKILIVYVEDRQAFVKALRDRGILEKDLPITHIPIDIETN
jgi:hypothetical protein